MGWDDRDSARESPEAELERLRARASELEEENRALRETRVALEQRAAMALAFVSHDLKSPLSTILLSAEVIRRSYPAGDRRRARKQIDTILTVGERMRRLIDDLHAAATLEVGAFRASPTAVPVRPLLEELQAAMAPLAAEREIRLEVAVAEGLPAVSADRDRIQQVLVNLAGNAIKFAQVPGRVRIEAARAGDDLQFSISDDGPGLPEETMARLLDQSWRAGPRPGRSGLGLFIAQGIVAAHGGRLWAQSRPGGGCTLSFTLPAAR